MIAETASSQREHDNTVVGRGDTENVVSHGLTEMKYSDNGLVMS
jgi:hypothetical protein